MIGKDTRLSGYMFEAALEAGFVAAGVDVIVVGAGLVGYVVTRPTGTAPTAATGPPSASRCRCTRPRRRAT